MSSAAVAAGARIRERRIARNWTLEHLADRAGISRQSLNSIELATMQPRLSTLLAIAEALRIPATDLLATAVDRSLLHRMLDAIPAENLAAVASVLALASRTSASELELTQEHGASVPVAVAPPKPGKKRTTKRTKRVSRETRVDLG